MVQAAFGDVGFRGGHFDNAERGYRAAMQLDPKYARGWYGMGRMYEMVSMYRHAKEAYAKAHELDPEDKQIEDYWLRSRPYAEQLAIMEKNGSGSPPERE